MKEFNVQQGCVKPTAALHAKEKIDALSQSMDQAGVENPCAGYIGLCCKSFHVNVDTESLLLEKGQLRDAVKSGGNQPTYISMIHRRSLLARALIQRICEIK